jgi:hypothetical protein
MVKFTPRTVCSGLVATVVLGGLVSVGTILVATLAKLMLYLASPKTANEYGVVP